MLLSMLRTIITLLLCIATLCASSSELEGARESAIRLDGRSITPTSWVQAKQIARDTVYAGRNRTF